MLRLAWRNLFESKGQLTISVGGIALALMLILALDAVFRGVEDQQAAYIEHAGADVVVSQAGVRTMHMGSSSLPATMADQVRAVPGVASVTPVLYVADVIRAGGKRSTAYVIGLPPDAEAGKPRRIVNGVANPSPGGAVIDRGVAERAGLGLGDLVTILGRQFTIAGLSEGTAALINSVVIISWDNFELLRGSTPTVSYLFVQMQPDQSAQAVSDRIAATLDGVTVQTRNQFADEERKLIGDMGADVIKLMNLFGFAVGLAVMALTVYTSTLVRQAEFGTLKAVGARNLHLYRAVLTQAFASVGFGLVVGVAFTLLLAVLAPRLGAGLSLKVGAGSVLKAAGVSIVIAGAAAALPIRRISGIDPAIVFRRQ